MSLDRLAKDFFKAASELEDGAKAKNFLKSEAKKLKTKTVSVARKKVGKKTGNYEKGIKAGKPYVFEGDLACRVYSTMPHAHLIEFGHNIIDKNGNSHGKTEGKFVFQTAEKEFEDPFEKATKGFLDEIVEGL